MLLTVPPVLGARLALAICETLLFTDFPETAERLIFSLAALTCAGVTLTNFGIVAPLSGPGAPTVSVHEVTVDLYDLYIGAGALDLFDGLFEDGVDDRIDQGLIRRLEEL